MRFHCNLYHALYVLKLDDTGDPSCLPAAVQKESLDTLLFVHFLNKFHNRDNLFLRLRPHMFIFMPRVQRLILSHGSLSPMFHGWSIRLPCILTCSVVLNTGLEIVHLTLNSALHANRSCS